MVGVVSARVVCGVAGITVSWCRCVVAIDVATGARDRNVCTGQRENRRVVVERSRIPSCC